MIGEIGALGALSGFGWAATSIRLCISATVTLAFAVLARAVRGVTWSGAFAGGIACFTLFAAGGPSAFATLVALFALTWGTTRIGYSRKQQLGLAVRREGRNFWQVSANLGVAALGSLAFLVSGHDALLIACVATLAEAATDTVASEIGQSSQRDARLITTWERVPAGTDGGMTISGTLAGFLAGTVISAIAVIGGLFPRSEFWIPVCAGFAGMLMDSLLGATVQRRGWISNQGVNVVSTLAAAALAYLLAVGSMVG